MSGINQTSCQHDGTNDATVLNDFGYSKISAIAIEKTTSQLRTNSTLQNSKRVRKFSLLNRSVLEDVIPSRIIPSYKVSPAANKKGGQKA